MPDLGEQAIQVLFKGGIMSLALLHSLAQQALDNRNQPDHGKQSLKKLNLQGKQLESIKITGQDIKAFQKQLNKYSVDFSIMKDRQTGEHSVFFKGQDTDRIYVALENVLNTALDRNGKKPMKEVMEAAIKKSKERAAQLEQTPEKTRHADRGER